MYSVIRLTKEMYQAIECRREQWATIARKNGWYAEPFYIQVWVSPEGTISDSVAYRGAESDIIIVECT